MVIVFTIVLSPVVLVSAIHGIREAVAHKQRLNELKVLRNSGVEHAVITNDYIKF